MSRLLTLMSSIDPLSRCFASFCSSSSSLCIQPSNWSSQISRTSFSHILSLSLLSSSIGMRVTRKPARSSLLTILGACDTFIECTRTGTSLQTLLTMVSTTSRPESSKSESVAACCCRQYAKQRWNDFHVWESPYRTLVYLSIVERSFPDHSSRNLWRYSWTIACRFPTIHRAGSV